MTLSRGLLLIGILGLSCLSTSIFKQQDQALAQQYIQTIKYRNLVLIVLIVLLFEKYSINITLSSEFRSISELRKLLAANCKIEKINPPVFASDAEVNIVTVTLVCPDGKTQTIRAYSQEAQSLREFIRIHT